jgi:hypothetical protein
MYLIYRTPNSTPVSPNAAEVVKITLSRRDHVEGKPVLMGASPRWCYWIMCFPPQKGTIESLLLGVTAEGACYPGLNTSAAREVNKALCEWLKVFD